MAKPPRNQLAMTDLGRSLAKLNKKQPATPKDIELWAYRNHDVRIGEETIRKAHKGQVDPTTCLLDLLIALMAFYEVEPAALGKFAERRITSVMAMAGGESGPRGQGTPPYRCTEPLSLVA